MSQEHSLTFVLLCSKLNEKAGSSPSQALEKVGVMVLIGACVGAGVGAVGMALSPLKQKSHDLGQASLTERPFQVCNFPWVLFLVQYLLNLISFFFEFFVIQSQPTDFLISLSLK
jgi:hypothetical protein